MNEYMEPGVIDQLTQPIKYSQEVMTYFWPDFSPTVAWVAFIIGILLYIVGYFAGGKYGTAKIFTCIVITTIIGFLARSVLNPFMAFLVEGMGLDAHTAFVFATTFWMFFISGVGVMIYETFTVTVDEADRR